MKRLRGYAKAQRESADSADSNSFSKADSHSLPTELSCPSHMSIQFPFFKYQNGGRRSFRHMTEAGGDSKPFTHPIPSPKSGSIISHSLSLSEDCGQEVWGL